MNKLSEKLLVATFGLGITNIALAQPIPYTPPSQSVTTLTDIPFNKAVQVDEVYRKEFENCDKNNIFKGVKMRNFRECSGDPNNFKALLKLPDGTIFMESKLGLDIDGSWKACKGGSAPTTQCPTSFNWSTETKEPNKFVDPDNFPYIVIPTTSVTGGNDKEFRNKTGISFGDFGVVIYKNKIVPVLVADGGPHNKIGEGASSLHRLIGEDKCKPGKLRTDGKTRSDKKWTSDIYCTDFINSSVQGKVLFFIFPGSRSEIAGLSPTQALAKIQAEALKRFEKLKGNSQNQSVIKLNQPTSGQSFSMNTSVTFSGTASPEVSMIKASIGPGGPFAIAELTNVSDTWTFTQTFRNIGKDRTITLQPFNSQNQPLQALTFTITIK